MPLPIAGLERVGRKSDWRLRLGCVSFGSKSTKSLPLTPERLPSVIFIKGRFVALENVILLAQTMCLTPPCSRTEYSEEFSVQAILFTHSTWLLLTVASSARSLRESSLRLFQ